MEAKVNVVKVAEDEDFAELKRLADVHKDWDLVYSKKTLCVWTRPTPQTEFKIIKMRAEYNDVSASVVYDVLHDPDYRPHWDKHMTQSVDIGCLNPNNDISYYQLKSPAPFRSRDFVLLRSWLETPTELMIINHSVCHDDYPPRKGVVRAISYLTGYLVRPLCDKRCQITYVAQTNPRGRLPSWFVNKLTQTFAPKMAKRLHRACVQYPAWKHKHNPNWKPWLYPEQMDLPRISLTQCVPRDYETEFLDESQVREALAVDDDDAQGTSGDEALSNGVG